MAEVKEVKLHSGPYHGETWGVPVEYHSIRVAGMSKPPSFESELPTDPVEAFAVREGLYTQVGSSDDFEWVGYQ